MKQHRKCLVMDACNGYEFTRGMASLLAVLWIHVLICGLLPVYALLDAIYAFLFLDQVTALLVHNQVNPVYF